MRGAVGMTHVDVVVIRRHSGGWSWMWTKRESLAVVCREITNKFSGAIGHRSMIVRMGSSICWSVALWTDKAITVEDVNSGMVLGRELKEVD